MLPKSRRISQAQAKEVFTRGRSSHSPSFTVKTVGTQGDTRFAISISKKVLPSAVDRNRLRRRIYSAIAKLIPNIRKGFLVGFLVKSEARNMSFADLSVETESSLRRAGILNS